jgi:hypothetical protein
MTVRKRDLLTAYAAAEGGNTLGRPTPHTENRGERCRPSGRDLRPPCSASARTSAIERAKTSVLIAGFRFDHGATLFRPLHERMQHGLTTVFFVDIEGEAKPTHDGRAFAERAIDRFVAKNWPFGPPHPAIYYDPHSAVAGPPWVSLHAKCIVIDDEVSLVTSANFTERGQTRNIEVGVCIEDREFAERLGAQWRALIARCLVARWGWLSEERTGTALAVRASVTQTVLARVVAGMSQKENMTCYMRPPDFGGAKICALVTSRDEHLLLHLDECHDFVVLRCASAHGTWLHHREYPSHRV